MAPRHKKLLAAFVSALIGAAAAVVFVRSRSRIVPVILRAAERSAESENVAAAEYGPGASPLEAGPRARFPRSSALHRPLTQEEFQRFFADRSQFDQFDPLCYYRARPNLDCRVDWAEHPRGFWTLRTNAEGFRRDGEISRGHPDLRILVTGDSHTDGVCSNDEAATHVLEQLLSERFPKRSVEALNVARGGYDFHQYLGVLQRYVELEPDVFVVAVYGGNDFDGTLHFDHYLRDTVRPSGSPEYYARIEAAQKIHPGALAQAFNAFAYFNERPDQVDLALAASRDLVTEIQIECLKRSIQLVVAYIPPMSDVQRPYFEDTVRGMRDALALSDDDLRITDRMATSLLDFLKQRGVAVVDLRARYRAAKEPVYWQTDHHINLAGHRILAEELAATIAERSPPDAPRVRDAYGAPSHREADLHALLFGPRSAPAAALAPAADFERRKAQPYAAEAWAGAWPQIEFDAERFVRWKPNLDVDVQLGSGPQASWRLRTNADGVRTTKNDPDTSGATRVLFCGDEQLAGGCAVEHGLAGETKRALARRRRGQAVACWDAGAPGQFLDAYLAAIEHCAPLAPTACVVVVNGGNDFLEGLAQKGKGRRGVPERSAGDAEDLEYRHALRAFEERPREAAVAVRRAVDVASAIARRCRELRSDLVFVYVPPECDVLARPTADGDPEEMRSAIDRAGTAWIEQMRALGVRVADLRPLLRGRGEPSFDASRRLLTHEVWSAVGAPLAAELMALSSAPAAIEASSSPAAETR